MIRRTLIFPKKVSMQEEDDEDSWLRNNIFRIRCTLGEKVCNMVINGSSCENLVSNLIVDKLNSICEIHPNPYHVSWIKKNNAMIINKMFLVNLSIRKAYKDVVWCDMKSMDASHILLGRAW